VTAAHVGSDYDDPEVVRRLLTSAPVWAVVGLRDNPARAAYGVAAALQRHGKKIVPVHPWAEKVHGATGYACLADIPFAVDVVDCFVNSSRVGAVVDEAIAVSARAVWLQLDVIDTAAADRAMAAGLDVVMDLCPAIEGPRLAVW
jgi:predicted CoA-binding protein